MKWTDTQRIAEELYDLHGDSIDPKTVRFTQLRDLIMALPEFDDDPARCGERILEAVQQAWIDEAESPFPFSSNKTSGCFSDGLRSLLNLFIQFRKISKLTHTDLKFIMQPDNK